MGQSTGATPPVPITAKNKTMIQYDSNNKQLSIDNDSNTDRLTNLNQINKLTTALVPETNPNFQPQPNNETTNMVKNMFQSGMQQAQNKNIPDALRKVDLAVDMRNKARKPWEPFSFQLQELHMMLRNRTDLELVSQRNLDAWQDLEMLLNCGMVVPEVFIRLTDCLLKLNLVELARPYCERGLSLDPKNGPLLALFQACEKKMLEIEGDL
ncbi:Sec63 complex subunit SEC72 [Kluyveromyces lactis]|uniref:KLLA0C05104p n=1 Tax=Kluyveromyces lactis (strain ATCC 8585 / CBS 2359 / DSM 70799 / NBRC 1267 / NRRL Y-1140 / WM37) TaxID=284590 RepID=Q6CUG1_KLULA|nr:uncharacterized protein KLLA0_C05104g [Kluyveromyces lactis]CAH01279.1 KLLA0C05104p [Kluyveromyces lactis]|eukprot:XP_452428.1 uncharacterized protein KLLA0_C05104g [Kluyveromyces lactis]